MTDPVGSQLVAAELDPTLEEPQIDLFADPVTPGGIAKLGDAERRRPGRPPGARNKFNERALAWLRAKYPDARERCLAIGTANPADLANLWRCSVFEAVQEQRLYLAIVLPFVAQKQPLSVDLNTKTAVYLTIDLGEKPGAGGIQIDVTPQALTSEEIQSLSGGDDAKD